ncbi:putative membrane protein [Propionicimonas paludicola]|uniref:Putative membrane protein n=1 Tax=Propionicimonas paludicola TaxID=185243 RepID=A0A2A9CX10_9ACTN|nr:DUF2177 family protein [Propionicimonas paludicola]PFG18170.1 putative membrane protein [Propionicimonas paludicola]
MSRFRRWLISYVVALVVFTLVDGVWIGLVASGVYRAELGSLLAASFQPVAAIVFYLGYVAGLVHFGVQPLAGDVPLGRRVLAGALFGLFTYGTWGLTALTVLNGFSAFVAVTDIAWGTALGALVTWLSTLLLRRFGVLRANPV